MNPKPTITNQEIFDKVWNHFVVNKGPASFNNESGMCKYRGDNGAKCAVGLFIPDEDYDPKIENYTANADRVTSLLPFTVNDSKVSYLLELQRCHDRAVQYLTNTEDFYIVVERRLRELAELHNLLIPCPLS